MKMVKSIVDRITPRAVNTSISVYSINGPYYVGYSLSSSPSQVSPTFQYDIIGNLIAGAEYLSLQKDFNFVKILGVGIHISPSIGNTTEIASLPNFYTNVYAGTQGTYNVSSAFISDNAVVFEPRMMTQGIVAYYKLPETITGTNGYPVGGNKVWISTGSLSATGVLNLLLGWNTAIPPQYVSGAANSGYRIATIDISMDLLFGGATYAS